jgi:hypothetical protein
MAFVSIYDAQFSSMSDFMNFINHARGPIGLSLDQIHSSDRRPLETKQGEDNKQRFERHGISQLTRLDMRYLGIISVFVHWLLGPRSHLGISHIHTLHINVPITEDDSVS